MNILRRLSPVGAESLRALQAWRVVSRTGLVTTTNYPQAVGLIKVVTGYPSVAYRFKSCIFSEAMTGLVKEAVKNNWKEVSIRKDQLPRIDFTTQIIPYEQYLKLPKEFLDTNFILQGSTLLDIAQLPREIHPDWNGFTVTIPPAWELRKFLD